MDSMKLTCGIEPKPEHVIMLSNRAWECEQQTKEACIPWHNLITHCRFETSSGVEAFKYDANSRFSSENKAPYRPDRTSNSAASAGLLTRIAWLALSTSRADTSFLVKNASSAPLDLTPEDSILPASVSNWRVSNMRRWACVVRRGKYQSVRCR